MMDIDTYDDLLEFLEVEDFEDVTLLVVYTNADCLTHKFRITDISKSIKYGGGYIDAFCIDKDGEYEGIERTFKVCPQGQPSRKSWNFQFVSAMKGRCWSMRKLNRKTNCHSR